MKALVWIGSSLKDLRRFPEEVRQVMGFALYVAQSGGKHVSARPLKGFRGASVIEVSEDHDSDTFRTVYTVQFKEAIYVLHAFQKKAAKGIATPRRHLELVRQRLTEARRLHLENRDG